MADWCDERGFQTTVTERRFDANFKVNPRERDCGGLRCEQSRRQRAALEDVGFNRVVEAGLGAGPAEYLPSRTTDPPEDRARTRWQGTSRSVPIPNAELLEQPAYDALRAQGLDECGLVQLAERTVGAPFVGAVAATFVVAELVRMAQGLHRYEIIDGSLRTPESVTAIAAEPGAPYNPGRQHAGHGGEACVRQSGRVTGTTWRRCRTDRPVQRRP